MTEIEYELFAIRYATREARRSDISSAAIRTTARCRWTISCGWQREEAARFVIDTGFNAEVAERRKRTFLRCPVETLGAFGIDPAAVEDVILTHLHYDHVGNFDRFPNARFHLQEREIAYATGRFMRYPRLSHSFEVEDICGIVRLNYARRVLFYDGDAELAPGLTIMRRAAIRPGCSSFASGPAGVLSCWLPTSVISTRTWRASVRLRPPFISAKCWRVSTSC